MSPSTQSSFICCENMTSERGGFATPPLTFPRTNDPEVQGLGFEDRHVSERVTNPFRALRILIYAGPRAQTVPSAHCRLPRTLEGQRLERQSRRLRRHAQADPYRYIACGVLKSRRPFDPNFTLA